MELDNRLSFKKKLYQSKYLCFSSSEVKAKVPACNAKIGSFLCEYSVV